MDPQISNLLQKLLAAGGPVAALISSKLGWDSTTTGLVLEVGLALATPLAAYLWGRLTNSEKGLVSSVAAAMPGASIVVGPTASATVKALANDPTVPGINMKGS